MRLFKSPTKSDLHCITPNNKPSGENRSQKRTKSNRYLSDIALNRETEMQVTELHESMSPPKNVNISNLNLFVTKE